jgi:hypothetical protein
MPHESQHGMRINNMILSALFAAATFVAAGPARAEKKGALEERADPAKDLEVQRKNVKKLRLNAELARKNGNRVAAWAAEQDAKHAEKLIEKDKKLLRDGSDKKSVDGEEVEKPDAQDARK